MTAKAIGCFGLLGFGTAAIFGILVLSECGHHMSDEELRQSIARGAGTSPSRNTALPKITILSERGVSDGRYMMISGLAQNTSGRAIAYAQVVYAIYDASGAKVGSALANINHLAPGEKWRFQAVCFCRGKSYDLDKITAY